MIESVARLIKSLKRISVLTGAGISVNAGIPDFRGEKGIYTLGIFSENVFDIDYFYLDPKPFYDFARKFYPIVESALPTKAHKFLSELEKDHSVCIVTQNIDLLHELAGSKNVIYLHGNVKESYCTKCGKKFSFDEMKHKIFESPVPLCDRCKGVIKPNVVFFGESVLGFDKASKCVENSQLFFALGTSLEVYPANLLVTIAKRKNMKRVLVNKSSTNFDMDFDFVFHEDLDDFFTKLSNELNKEG